ncbi:MAG: PEGA domain-containing protein [Pirellulales bacterium]
MRLLTAALLACCLAWLSGCSGVQRRLTIRSNPPGAQVYVDNYPIGTTPCSTDFLYYGTREIRLVRDGFETLTIKQPIPAPWYQIPPLDFVSDNLLPREVRDERTLVFDMTPQVIVPTDSLLSRAEMLRQDANVQPATAIGVPPGGWSTAPPATLPAPGAVPQGALPSPGQQGTIVPSQPAVPQPQSLPPTGRPLERLPEAVEPGAGAQTLPPGGSPPVFAPP